MRGVRTMPVTSIKNMDPNRTPPCGGDRLPTPEDGKAESIAAATPYLRAEAADTLYDPDYQHTLDAVDALRGTGVAHNVKLPPLVCYDQGNFLQPYAVVLIEEQKIDWTKRAKHVIEINLYSWKSCTI